MKNNKSKIFPIFITIIIIVIVISLFANLKQSNVTCSKKTMDDLGITIVENVDATLDGSKIVELNLIRKIILPEKYLKDDKYLEYIQKTLEKSYAYLGKGKVKFSKLTDRLIVYVDVKNRETLILDNVSFTDLGTLQMNINPNTKSSDVATLRVSDNYTEGQLMTYLKSKGYSCS